MKKYLDFLYQNSRIIIWTLLALQVILIAIVSYPG